MTEFHPQATDRPDVETDFSAQRAFFTRLERELEAASRAGYDYLTVLGPRSNDFYYGLVIAAEFVPHNNADKYLDESRRSKVTTYPTGDF